MKNLFTFMLSLLLLMMSAQSYAVELGPEGEKEELNQEEAISDNFYSFNASEVLPYKANYKVMRRGSTHGTATKSVKMSAETSTVEISYSSEARYLIFSDKRSELSQFSFDQGLLKSEYYQFTRTGTGKDRSQELYFDHNEKAISNGNQEVRIGPDTYSKEFLDPLSYQLMMQIALKKGDELPAYSVANRNGDIRTYSFEILGEEEIELPIGTFKSIKLVRKSNSKKRYANVWMIPSLNFVLGKLQLIEEEKESFMLQLESVEWLERDIPINKVCCE